MESKFIETVINIKECGVATSAMVKELIGKIKEIINFAVNTLETGMKGCDMGEELFSLRMEIVTTGIGWLEDHMDKVEWYMEMVIYIKADGIKGREMVMEC